MSKRLFDLAASGMGLFALSSLFLLTTFAIRFGSPGLVFHYAARLGKDGVHFRLYRFCEAWSPAPIGVGLASPPRATHASPAY